MQMFHTLDELVRFSSNTVTQYLLMNVTNAQTLKKGTRNETEVMEN